jgi:hypothetical protein
MFKFSVASSFSDLCIVMLSNSVSLDLNNFTQALTHYFEVLARTPILTVEVYAVICRGATEMLVYTWKGHASLFPFKFHVTE